MVSSPSSHASPPTGQLTSHLQNVGTRLQPQRIASAGRRIDTVGVQSLRSAYHAQGFSPEVADLMLKAKRTTTHRQYNTYISAWLSHCTTHNISPTVPTIPQALSFLEKLRTERQLGYNALNTARSALSSLLVHVKGIPFGQNHNVKLYMRGAFQIRPPCPRYTTTWDPDIVLRFLKTWSPACDIDLYKLTLKTLMLLLLVSGQRISTISHLSLDHVAISSAQIVFYVFDSLKQSRPGYKNPVLTFKAFTEDVDLCIVTCLHEYLSRTSPIRGDDKCLFVTIKSPHRGASKDTLTRWVRALMTLAGLDTSIFRPHSVRSASTSAAKRGGASVTEIMSTAGWSSTSTFRRFYDRPVNTLSMFDVAVLSNKS